MRFGMVTQWYDPEPGSAAVPATIARSLAGLGHEMHVLTGFPNYPSGRLAEGYALRPYRYERMRDVHVHRVPLLPNHDRSAVRRAGNYLSFAAAATVGSAVLRRSEAVLVYSTPATVAVPALVAQVRSGPPYVLLIQDLWPDTVLESGFLSSPRVRAAAERVLGRFCDLTYRRAQAIAVTSPGMAEVLQSRGVPESKISLVPNWVDEEAFRPRAKNGAALRQAGVPDGFTVMYAGSLGDLQGLETLVDAVDRLPGSVPAQLVLVGAGVAESRLREMVSRRSLSNVHFLGQRPVGDMGPLLAASDVQVVCLRDLPLFRSTLPSKVQATLASGRAIVASAPGDAARVVTESGAGIAVAPERPDDLAAAMRRLYDAGELEREAMAARGRRHYEQHFAEAVGSRKIEALLVDAATKGATHD